MTDAHLYVIGILLAWMAGIRAYLTVFGVGLGRAARLGRPAAGTGGNAVVVGAGHRRRAGTGRVLRRQDPRRGFGLGPSADLARVPAGAFLTAATLSPDGQLGAGALAAGAGVALASHGLKAGSRALLNTSPEPASNWIASATEDTLVVGGLALAMAHPWIALLLVVGISVVGALLVWWIWRTLSRGVRRLFTPTGT